MTESIHSINLMRLNCERINIINTEPYLKGVRMLSQNKKSRMKRIFSSKNILQLIKQKVKYEIYKRKPAEIYDFDIPFKQGYAEDFMINDYHNVGRGVVYTAVFGGYDNIDEPMFVNPNLEYYAFTDCELPQDSVWKKVDISKFKQLEGLDDYHKAKYIKMFPHEFFPEFDFSIWVDGNVALIADTYPIAVMADGSPIATYANPIHNCIYTEGKYMLFQRRVPKQELQIQLGHYRDEGFPEHFGMREFSIIYRNHKRKDYYELMNQWWDHVNKYTMRDQLSLPFILWKNGFTIDYIKCLGENWRWNPRFLQKEHHRQIIYDNK